MNFIWVEFMLGHFLKHLKRFAWNGTVQLYKILCNMATSKTKTSFKRTRELSVFRTTLLKLFKSTRPMCCVHITDIIDFTILHCSFRCALPDLPKSMSFTSLFHLRQEDSDDPFACHDFFLHFIYVSQHRLRFHRKDFVLIS